MSGGVKSQGQKRSNAESVYTMSACTKASVAETSCNQLLLID